MKKILLITIITLSYTVGAVAQDNLLLKKYRQMALEYNHDLKTTQRSILSSIELEKAARSDKGAKLSAGANFQYTGNPMQIDLNLPSLASPLSFQGQDMQYGASVSLEQPIYTGGRILESIRIAKNQTAYATHQNELVRSSVCFQTDMQYWNTVARAELLAITEEFRNSIRSFTELIKERVDVGMVDPQDLLMTQVKLNEADYQLLQAQNSFQTGRMALNSLLGVELVTSTLIENTIPSVVDTSALDVESTRPEVDMAHDKIAIQKGLKQLNDSKFKPQLYVGANAGYSAPGYDFKPDLSPNYALYAKLSVPIFEWGKRNEEKRANQYKTEIAVDNLNKVEDAVDLEIQTAQLNLKQSAQRVKLTENSLSKAYENELKAIERYNEGKISIVEIIDAQVYKQTAQINYVQAKLAQQNNYSELLRVLNVYNLQ